eukprot:Nk52_evm48s151 gene=Nk52_evmTU48s151
MWDYLNVSWAGAKAFMYQFTNKHRPYWLSDVTENVPVAQREGRVCIVTGGNGGIGFETARCLTSAGYTVIMGCRSSSRGREAVDKIRKELRDEGLERYQDNIRFMPLDLGSFKSINAFVDKFMKEKLPGGVTGRLDVLINNAGVMLTPYGKTEDGLETQIGTNHFGHFLLTLRLLPLLKKSGSGAFKSRIVNVSSSAHYPGYIKFGDIDSSKSYNAYQAYAQSKLANVLFSYELSRRLEQEGASVTVNALHPGVIDTNLYSHLPSVVRYPQSVMAKYLFKDAIQGAATSLYVATEPSLEGVTGKYFDNCEMVDSSTVSYNVNDQKNLWKLSEKITKVKY